MEPYSKYATTADPAAGIPARRLMGALAGSGLLLFVGLGQLQLKFALADVQQETTKLQSRKLELASQINKLRGEVEGQKRGGDLLEYAENELGMVHYPPAQWEKMVIASDIRERYAEAMVAIANKPKLGDPAGHDDKLTAWGNKLILMTESKAEARTE